MSLLVKALLLIWPFLKLALFRDKTIKQVLLDNMHLVVIYGCVLMLALTLSVLYIRHEYVKSENVSLTTELTQCDHGSKDILFERKAALSKLLK